VAGCCLPRSAPVLAANSIASTPISSPGAVPIPARLRSAPSSTQKNPTRRGAASRQAHDVALVLTSSDGPSTSTPFFKSRTAWPMAHQIRQLYDFAAHSQCPSDLLYSVIVQSEHAAIALAKHCRSEGPSRCMETNSQDRLPNRTGQCSDYDPTCTPQHAFATAAPPDQNLPEYYHTFSEKIHLEQDQHRTNCCRMGMGGWLKPAIRIPATQCHPPMRPGCRLSIGLKTMPSARKAATLILGTRSFQEVSLPRVR